MMKYVQCVPCEREITQQIAGLDAIVVLAGSIAFAATTPNFWKCRQMRSAVTHLFAFSADKVTLTFKVKCVQEH